MSHTKITAHRTVAARDICHPSALKFPTVKLRNFWKDLGATALKSADLAHYHDDLLSPTLGTPMVLAWALGIRVSISWENWKGSTCHLRKAPCSPFPPYSRS